MTFAVLVGAEPTANGTAKVVDWQEANSTYRPNAKVWASVRGAEVSRLLVAEFAVKQVEAYLMISLAVMHWFSLVIRHCFICCQDQVHAYKF